MFLLINDSTDAPRLLKERYQLFDFFDVALREAKKLGFKYHPPDKPSMGCAFVSLYDDIDITIMHLEVKA